MTFAALPLSYLLGIGAVVATLVVGLYLLRRTPRSARVSNVDFWLRAAERARPARLFHIRIPLAALLLSLLVALSIVALLGDPRFGDAARNRTVVVVDAGGSMAARSGRSGRRIDEAIRQVVRWSEESTIAGEITVVRAGMQPTVWVPATLDPAEVDAALRVATLDDGPSDMPAALALADAILGDDSGVGRILIVTDQPVDVATRAPRTIVPVGDQVASVGISSFAARRLEGAQGEYVVRCEVATSGPAADVRVRVRDGEVDILDERVQLEPFGRVVLTGHGFGRTRAHLRATIEDVRGVVDGWTTDDVADAVLPALERSSVLLVGARDRFLDAALRAHPGLAVTARASLDDVSPAQLANFDAVVLVGVRAPSLEHRSVLVFAPPPSSEWAAGELSDPPITGVMSAHPALDGVRLHDGRLSRAVALRTERSDTVLMRSGESTLALVRQERSRREVVFGFRPSDFDLARGERFPLLVHAALRWALARDEAPVLARPLGSILEARTGEALIDPDGVRRVEPVLRVMRAGVWTRGSDPIAYRDSIDPAENRVGTTGGRFAHRRSIPPLALLASAALLVAMLIEWVLLHRGKLGS